MESFQYILMYLALGKDKTVEKVAGRLYCDNEATVKEGGRRREEVRSTQSAG